MATRIEVPSPIQQLIDLRLWIFLLIIYLSSGSARAEDAPRLHVLLIGCGEYDVGPDVAKPLYGPQNDIVLAHNVLSAKFSGLNPQFQVLSRPAVQIEGVTCSPPTYKNIKAALQELAVRMRKGDKAFVMFCGHGTYQPNFDQEDWEGDGKDEVFLPVDFTTDWDEKKGSFVNVLVDDEIRVELGAIAAKEKTSVCVFFDSCHSATAARAGSRLRSITDKDGLMAYLPEPVKMRWKQLQSNPPVKKERNSSKLPQNVIAFYATSPGEAAPEGDIPPRTTSGRKYGYHSYTFFQALSSAQDSISPDELNRLVCSTYCDWKLTEPTPMVEGNDKYRGFLDLAKIERSQITLSKLKDTNDLIINAGELASVYEGTVLAVYPKIPRQNQEPTGYVKVEAGGAGILRSKVKPIKWPEDGPSERAVLVVDELENGSRCEVASYKIGAGQIHVAIKSVENNGEESPLAQQLRVRLTEASKGKLAKYSVVDAVADADWVTWVDGDQAFLVNVGELSPSGTLKTEGSYRRYEPSGRDNIGDWINKQLETIARYHNLFKVTKEIQRASMSREADDAQFEVRFRDHHGEDDWTGTLRDNIPEEVFLGDRFSFQITNKTKGAIDVSMLYLDSDYGISPYFPESRSAGDNRLASENSVISIQNGLQRSLVNKVGPRLGRDRILILVAKVPVGSEVTTPPVDFTIFAQASLEGARKLGSNRGTNAFGTALGELLAEATYRNGSRSIRTQDLKEVSARIISWNVRERTANPSSGAETDGDDSAGNR